MTFFSLSKDSSISESGHSLHSPVLTLVKNFSSFLKEGTRYLNAWLLERKRGLRLNMISKRSKSPGGAVVKAQWFDPGGAQS